ncbi:MAG: hypothetical protein U0414_39230 [Polyangiaceae bacterium]
MLALYGSAADKLRIASSDDLQLTEMGRKLGDAFIRETGMPSEVRDAVIKSRTIDRAVLAAWGRRAHINAGYGDEEATSLVDIVEHDPTRLRMCRHLRAHARHEGESELQRFGRLLGPLEDSTDRDLAALGFTSSIPRETAVEAAAQARVTRGRGHDGSPGASSARA